MYPNVITIDDAIKKLESLQPVSCPLYQVDYPCVICLQCPRANYQEFYIGNNGFMKWTSNSAIISFRLPLRDDLDRLLLGELIKELAKRLRFLMETPEEGFHVSLFIKHTDMADPKTADQIRTFLKRDLNALHSIITQGRGQIREWASRVVSRMISSARFG